MRLQQYITEGKEPDQLEANEANYKKIKKDCAPYFKWLKGREPFRRSVQYDYMDEDGNHPILKKAVRRNRNPIGTDKMVFRGFNKWAKEHGIPSRAESVSVLNGKFTSMGYSGLYYFFPMGELDYGWIEARDFNDWTGPKAWLRGAILDYLDGEMGEAEAKKMLKNFHGNEGLDTAYNKQFEVWFRVPHYYYLMHPNEYERLSK